LRILGIVFPQIPAKVVTVRVAIKPPPIKTICRNKQVETAGRQTLLCGEWLYGMWCWKKVLAKKFSVKRFLCVPKNFQMSDKFSGQTICSTIRKSISFMFFGSFFLSISFVATCVFFSLFFSTCIFCPADWINFEQTQCKIQLKALPRPLTAPI